MKIDFGGGEGKTDGYKSCDIIAGTDYQCDFENDKLPFKDNSVDEAVCNHTLEHIVNTRHFLNELHRVLKGDIRIVVPFGLWEGACKPVHVNIISASWFDFLRKEASYRIYGYKTWDIKSIEEKEKNNTKYEIICVMKPKC